MFRRQSSILLFSSASPILLNRMMRKNQSPQSIDPHNSDGNVGNSFEHIVEDIGQNMPFKVTQEMYDRPTLSQDPHPEAHHSATSGVEAANKQLKGQELDSARTPREDSRTFEKTYDPDILRTSTADPEHQYAPPPTAAELAKKRQLRHMAVLGTVAALCLWFFFFNIVPRAMKNLAALRALAKEKMLADKVLTQQQQQQQ